MITIGLLVLATILVFGKYIIERILEGNKTKKIVGFIIAILTATLMWGSYKIQGDERKELIAKIDSNTIDQRKNLIEQKQRDDVNEKNRTVLSSKIDSLQSHLNPFLTIAATKFPQLQSEAALTMLANDIEKQNNKISAMQYYSEVSKLGLNGKTNNYGYGMIETTPISEFIKPAITIEKDHVVCHCDPEAYKLYKAAIIKFPNFPFSYYFLSKCLYAHNDPDWRSYAIKSIGILKYTTMIDGHSKHHDEILKELNESVKN